MLRLIVLGAGFGLPGPCILGIDRTAGKDVNPRHKAHGQRPAAGEQLEIAPLAAQQDQRGRIARPDDTRLGRDRVDHIIHCRTMRKLGLSDHMRLTLV